MHGQAGWTHFRTHVLPRVAAQGYTALLLLGVHEHGYYASFGYQATSYFAPASRFGSPSELQELVDAAHGYGLLVLFELVHSHASSNVREGLNLFDGSEGGAAPSLGPSPPPVEPGCQQEHFDAGSKGWARAHPLREGRGERDWRFS